MGQAIGNKWDRLGRRLPGIEQHHIEEIQDRYNSLPERGFQILRRWKEGNGKDADYKALHDALVDELVQAKNLAQEYCQK